MKRNILRLLLSAAFVMCCTMTTWAGLGTPPDNEIWYTSRDGNVIAPYYDNVFGATIQSNTYNDGKGVIKFNGPVTQVGDWAFYKTNLTSMSLPNSVKTIGYAAFYWMDYMTEISLGNSVETIGNEAFRECDGLVTIAIPASVTSMGEQAFRNCNNLKFVAIGRGVTNISQSAFYNCNELKSVAIDGNGVTLGYEAFYDCEKLESVSFLSDTPPSSFGNYCFSNCSPNLKYHVLEECYDRYNNIGILSGKVVKGPPYNEIWYTTNNGETAGYTFHPQYLPPLNAYMGNHGVQFFDGNPPEFNDSNNCFKDCTNLVSAVLPSSITSIGKSAFERCTNLVSVSIPNSVTGDIGNFAFYECSQLVSISIPNMVTGIGVFAFDYTGLQTITIPERVNHIGRDAFCYCPGLRSVTILGTIASIGESAFVQCDNLYDIFYFGDGTPTVVTGGYDSFGPQTTIYVKDLAGHGNWGNNPVRSWRSGKGDGSQGNPLEIENYINLYGFALEVNILGSNGLCGKLTADIVGNSNVLKADGSLNGTPSKEWLPIGSSDKVFCGEFNGNGHTISGLYHNHSDSSVGLFGRTGDGAYIHDLGLVDSYMSGGGLNGGICGDLAYGHIDNCYNAATVAWGGGIAGWCREHARISNCHNIGHIFSNGSGIVDAVFRNPNVTYSVENCYALEGVSISAINNNNGSIDKVVVKNAAAFTGGEVCKLLNDGNGGTLKWFHKSSTGSNPTLSGDFVGNYTNGVGYEIQTLCTSSNHLHNMLKTTVYKCNDSQYVYWHCSKCGENFKDIDKTLPESDANMSRHFPEYVDDGYIPTATTTGRYSHWHCTNCNHDFKDEFCAFPATEESMTVPVAQNNEIWYKTSNNQKLTPCNTNAFGVTYNDAGNVYEYGLGVIRFGGNVTSIGQQAFHTCQNLTSITIPNSVTSIGYEAFMFCTNLTSITIPESVTSIGSDAFYQCRHLTSIAFQSLPSVGQLAFEFCFALHAKSLLLTDSDKPYIGTSLGWYPAGGFTEARYHGALEPGEWGTITLPFVPSNHSGIVFFAIDNVDAENGILTLSVAENIEAGKPYLFRNQTDAAGFTLTATPVAPATNVPVNVTTSDQTVGSFALKGTFQAKELTENGLYEQQGGEFVKVDSLSIDPFRAYLKDNGGSGVTSIVIDGGGIAFLKITNQDDSSVTLFGLKKVEFIKENNVPAVRVTYADDSTETYHDLKKVDFGK